MSWMRLVIIWKKTVHWKRKHQNKKELTERRVGEYLGSALFFLIKTGFECIIYCGIIDKNDRYKSGQIILVSEE